MVIGLDCMTGLQTARILARRGARVDALAADLRHPCARTRVCRRIVEAPLAGEGLLRSLLAFERAPGDDPSERALLVPCSDAAVLILSRRRELLAERYHLALPAPDLVETLIDKVRFHAHAEALGLPLPPTFFLRSRADALAAAGRLRYPCILKPPFKTPRWQAETKAKVFKAPDAEALLALYDRCRGWAELLMAQSWIPGSDADLYSYNGYFDRKGQALAGFVARKLRQWPTETGTSSLGQECRNDVVQELALRLFGAPGYHGLAYLEVKRDPTSGEHLIVEPNIGRPTGRSAIAEAGGVEILQTMLCDVLGRPLPAARRQRYGQVKWLHLRRDAQSAFAYWRRGELGLGDWWRSWRGPKAHALYDHADPLPFWADLAEAGRLALGRAAGAGRIRAARVTGGRRSTSS